MDIKVIVIGLGNPVLGDDGVGWRVAALVKEQVNNLAIEVDFLAGGGLSVMERLVGYDAAVIIDAINLGDVPVGTVRLLKLADLPNPFAGHLGSAHETSLVTAMQLGRSLGAYLPERVMIVAIESPYVYDFSEELTQDIAAVMPVAAKMVLTTIGQLYQNEI